MGNPDLYAYLLKYAVMWVSNWIEDAWDITVYWAVLCCYTTVAPLYVVILLENAKNKELTPKLDS